MLRLSNRKTDQRERMRDGQPGSLEREKERESQWGKKKQKKARWADKHRVNHGEAPQCWGRMENGSAGLGRVSRSVRGLALSMLTGRQPVYRERKKKKHQGNPALVYPQLNYCLDPKMGGVRWRWRWRWMRWGGIIFFDEKGRSKCAQKMYIRTVRPSGLTSHNFAHLFLFVPRASS